MFMSAVSERIPKILEYIGFLKKKHLIQTSERTKKIRIFQIFHAAPKYNNNTFY